MNQEDGVCWGRFGEPECDDGSHRTYFDVDPEGTTITAPTGYVYRNTGYTQEVCRHCGQVERWFFDEHPHGWRQGRWFLWKQGIKNPPGDPGEHEWRDAESNGRRFTYCLRCGRVKDAD